jgi:peroxiredoxin
MKKILLILAASAFIVSCNKLADNQFEITGTVDPSLNGKNVFLETQGGMMGITAVDTVKIENGKFLFKGNVTSPSLHFIQVEGVQGKADFILEEGEIEVAVDKDSIFKSTRTGTYNNEKLSEYYGNINKVRKTVAAFQKKNQAAMMKAYQTNDTVVMNKLNKEYEKIGKEMETIGNSFVENNPKAYITVLLLKQMANSGKVAVADIKKKFDRLDEEVKKTKEGKEVEDLIKNGMREEEAKANVTVGKKAPDFTASTPDGKKLSLKEAMGKVTIIDFWASWCKPCRMENPNVVAMYNELHAQGLNIIGVSLDKAEGAEQWKEAIAADKLTWNHVSNLKWWDEPIAKQYGVNSIPATFVIDAKGNIAATNLKGDALKAKVKELLAQ